jgi:ABC-2 type transport system permease protein
LIWWALGFIALTITGIAAYPAVRDNPGIAQIMESLPRAIRVLVGDLDIVSPAGYLNSRMFMLLLPLMFLIYAIGRGANAIAGEEERKTIDLLLAHPIDRKRVVIEKFLALATLVAGLGILTWLTLWLSAISIDMPIAADRLAAAMLSSVLLALLFGTLALAVGSATGRRGTSIGVSTAVGVLGFFVHGLAPLVEELEFTQKLSPFYYYIGGDPLRNGLHSGHVAVLVAATLGLLLVAVISFSRRDLAV